MTQVSLGEVCAHRIVLSIVFIHLYHGASEAYAATQTRTSITSAANFDFTQYPFIKTDDRTYDHSVIVLQRCIVATVGRMNANEPTTHPGCVIKPHTVQRGTPMAHYVGPHSFFWK